MLTRFAKESAWFSVLLLFAVAGNRPVTAQQQSNVVTAQKSKPLLTLPGCSGQFYRIALSPDGKRIACPGHVLSVPIRDPSTADKIVPILGIPWPVRDLAPVNVRDVATGEKVLNLVGHTRLVSDLAVSPDGKRLATASWDETARLWDAGTGQNLHTLKPGSGKVQCVAFSPDSQHLATASQDGATVTIWNVKTGNEVRTIGGQAQGSLALAYSPDGRRIAAGGLGGFVKVWDTTTGKEVCMLSENRSAYVYGVSFSPDSKRVATAAIPLGPRTHTVKIWDATTGKLLLSIQTEPMQDTYSVAFSPDGQFVASGVSIFQENVLEAAGVVLWDAATGKKVFTVPAHDREVYCVLFSNDGKSIVSASADGTIKIWDLAKLFGK